MSKRKIDAIEEVEGKGKGKGKKEFKDEDEDEDEDDVLCAICMDLIGSVNCCTTACNHQFHLTCIFQSRRANNSCPICREQFETDLPMIPNQDEEEEEDENEDSSQGWYCRRY